MKKGSILEYIRKNIKKVLDFDEKNAIKKSKTEIIDNEKAIDSSRGKIFTFFIKNT